MKKIILIENQHKAAGVCISNYLDFDFFSFQDWLFEEINSGKETGELIKKIYETGKQPPDEYITSIIKEKIINLKKNGIIISGFPQTLVQAKNFNKFLFDRKINPAIFLYFETQYEISENYGEFNFDKIYVKDKKLIKEIYKTNNVVIKQGVLAKEAADIITAKKF
jgi:adenylate kinase family enzyme